MNRIDLYITNCCNLCCKHCYMENQPLQSLSFDNIKEVLKLAQKDYFNSKIDIVSLLGGEPTIHHEFEKIVDYLNKQNYITQISTNGYFLLKYNLETLKKINYIQLSCECLDEQVLNNYRGDGYYDNLIKVSKCLKENNIDFGYKFLIAKDTIPHLQKSIILAKQLGAKRISASRFIPIGNGIGNQVNALTKDDIKFAYETIFNTMIKNNIFIYISDGIWFAFLSKHLKQNLNFKGCAILNGSINVVANGDILLCRKVDKTFGNILKNKKAFKELKANPIYIKLQSRELKGKCATCKYKSVCGGCRAHCYATGDLFCEDDLCFIC